MSKRDLTTGLLLLLALGLATFGACGGGGGKGEPELNTGDDDACTSENICARGLELGCEEDLDYSTVEECVADYEKLANHACTNIEAYVQCQCDECVDLTDCLRFLKCGVTCFDENCGE